MDERDDLIEQLLVIAAGIMEDASAALVLRDERSVVDRVELAQLAAHDLTAIAGALAVLQRRVKSERPPSRR